MIVEFIFYFIFGAIAVAAGIMLIVAKNPVHSAMYLVVNFFCMAVLFLILNAQFVAVVQVLVYAGAIMVLFVFVIMLLNATGAIEQVKDELKYNKLIGGILGVVLLAEGALIYRLGLFETPAANTKPLAGQELLNFGTPEAIGRLFFTKYLLPFEVTSILLLIAMVGALVIGKRSLDQR